MERKSTLTRLSDSDLVQIGGGMLTVTTGSSRPLISPATSSNFFVRDLGNRMAGGAVAGGVRGYQTGGPAGVPAGLMGGTLAAGMGYCATHSTGSGPTPSSNLNAWMTSPSHPKPMTM